MRDIKFRAWDGIRMTTTGIQFNNTNGELKFIPKGILMQYTGLEDHSTALTDIYEGDYLLVPEMHQKLEVFYTDGGFNVLFEDDDERTALTQGLINANYMTVEGNIYANHK